MSKRETFSGEKLVFEKRSKELELEKFIWSHQYYKAIIKIRPTYLLQKYISITLYIDSLHFSVI